MAPVRNQLLRKARRAREPGGIRLSVRRIGSALSEPFLSARHRWRLLRLRRSSTDRPRQWLSRPWMAVTTTVIVILSLLFVLWLARSLAVIVLGRQWDWPAGFNPDRHCAGIGMSCGAVTGWVTSLLSVALAALVFLLWRFWRVQRWYRRKARKDPRDLVPTAGSLFGNIVGRNDLCRVIMEDLRDRRSRRPHVLVGGVGTGKTAVLIRLTKLLAERRAVAVPVRLRDRDTLDFAGFAAEQFQKTVNEHLASGAEGEKTWRRLLRDGRIVVLADGLEEAMPATTDSEERDTRIRIAIHEAHEQHLPLLVASRPHAPLQDMDATVYELEPLNQDDALACVQEGRSAEEDRRLRWIIQTADAASAPLYLQITKDIYAHDMLDQIIPRETRMLGAASHDRSRLRLRLLQTWESALVSGRLRPEVPIKPDDRRATLDFLSALACAGLKEDSLQAPLDAPLSRSLRAQLPRRYNRAEHPPRLTVTDMRLAVAWGARLGLVEPSPGGARFQHSLIQAYLGSRMLGAVLEDGEFMTEALYGATGGQGGLDHSRTLTPRQADGSSPEGHARPGREFLIALVLLSRRLAGDSGASAPAADVPDVGRGRDWLAKAARDRRENGLHCKALDIYAAALEISSVAPDRPAPAGHSSDGGPLSRPRALAATTVTRAPDGRADPQRPSSPNADGAPGGPAVPGAAAMTHLDLATEVAKSWDGFCSGDPQTLEEAKLGLIQRFGDSLRTRAERHDGEELGYAQLYAICCAELSYRVRLAAAQEIGFGGTHAHRELWPDLEPLSRRGSQCPQCPGQPARSARRRPRGTADSGSSWVRPVNAWLTPMLITSIDANGGGEAADEAYRAAQEDLRQWLRHVRPDDGHRALTCSEEITLAQGFKYAANHHHRRLHTLPRSSGLLRAQALEMLKHARYWFSQLTLMQALCLWELEASEASADAGASARNPDAVVNRWLDAIDSDAARDGPRGRRRFHPFVEAAADLAVRALETGRPERFLWMDESDVVARVGSSRETTAEWRAEHDLWILPSMGWSGLDPRAQQLVADVLLLLNLAERGEDPETGEKLLRHADRDDLPPCLTRDRRALRPGWTVGAAEQHQPGSTCLPGCAFDLCPYPPKGQQRPRAELSEAFCRHQHMLVRRARLGRRTAPWQGLRAGQLRTFWTAMADRVRTTSGGA